MKIQKFISLIIISLLLVACSGSKNSADLGPSTITPPPGFDSTTYLDPINYGLDPEVKAEINKQAGDEYSEESDFRKAKIIGGLKKLQQNADYPRQALKYRVEGRVKSKIYVDENGKLTNIDILSSPNEALTTSAKRAIIKTNFKPATLKGNPVKSILLVNVLYQLYSQKLKIETNL